MAMKCFFDFQTSGHGKRYIEEPEGLRSADFSIEQDENRFGRDVAFAGGKNKLKIYSLPDHCFDIVLLNRYKYGFEAVIKFGIEFDESTIIIGEVDLYSSITDGINYIEFTVIEESHRALLKTRYEANTNLLSNKDLDNNDILPVPYTSLLIKAKPLRQKSVWKNPTIGQSFEFNPMAGADFINPVKQQVLYAVEDSLTWLFDRNDDTGADFIHLRAGNNLLNLEVELKHKVTWQYIPFFPSSQRQGSIRIRVVWGQTIGDGINLGQSIDLYYEKVVGNTTQNITLPELMTATIPFVNATDGIWITYTIGSLGSSQVITFNESTTTIIASSVAFNTVVPAIRLIDAIKYVVKSASGLTVDAPRFDIGGELYNQYITTTSLMRRLMDKPINVSFKDVVEGWLAETMSDYSIRTNNTVFCGFYRDYYRNVELGSYIQDISDGYQDIFNERYGINLFRYKYKNFQASKENQDGNTYDTVNGEAEYINGNKKAKNIKEISVGLTRDAFIIEQNRRKAYDLSDDTATQDDDKIFCLDVVPLEDKERKFTNTASLKHQYTTGFLTLTNNSKFSWLQLGIVIGSVFRIDSGVNAAQYAVVNVTDTELTLQSTTTRTNIAAQNTTFTYYVGFTTQLVNRTNEGFDIIDNIEEGDNFSNLRFTVKRNILKYCSEYLAATTLYSKGIPYRNTLYKNNPEAITRLAGRSVLNPSESVKEGGEFTPTGQLLEPKVVTTNLIMSRIEWLTLQDRIRNENGFIRTHYTDGMPLKGYVKKGSWVSQSTDPESSENDIGFATVELEVKYESFFLDIFRTNKSTVVINGQEFATNEFEYKIDEYEKLSIFDETGMLIFYPTPYDRVRVNNSKQPESTIQLQQWLNAIK